MADSPALSSSGTSGGAESSLRELGHAPSLEDALSSLDLLSETNSAKLERACVRWHGRLETDTVSLSLAESQLALAALASLCAGEQEAVEVLERLLLGCGRHFWPVGGSLEGLTVGGEESRVVRHRQPRRRVHAHASREGTEPSVAYLAARLV